MRKNSIQNFFKGKKILITGHTGFKGSWLTQILLNFGAEVIGVSLPPQNGHNLFNILKLNTSMKSFFLDIRNYKQVSRVLKRESPTIVFHLAAQAILRESYKNPLLTFSTNVLGTANILEAIRLSKTVRAAVIITTDKVYTNKKNHGPFKETDPLCGIDPYSASKAASDILVQSYIDSFFNPKGSRSKNKSLIAVCRGGNVLGGGDWGKDRLMVDLIRAIFEKDKNLQIRNPHSIRPWLYILDSLNGYLMLARNLYKGNAKFSGAWNFGPDPENFISVKKLIEKLPKSLTRIDYRIIKDESKFESEILKLDNSKAKRVLGWSPSTTLEETILETVKWYKNYYEGEVSPAIFTNLQINSFHWSQNEM